MKDEIEQLDPQKAKLILKDFLGVYLDKGFGVMNKTEIETLLYHVLKQNRLLSGKCFDDSFALQITEAKARKLIYESQIKYGTKDKDELTLNLRKGIGECLQKAIIIKNNSEIKFAIEDKYLRVALNAKLRDNGTFSDTSFNTDIVSLNSDSFGRLMSLLVPNNLKENVLNNLIDLDVSNDTKSKDGESFWQSLLTDILSNASVDGLMKLGKCMMEGS